SGGVLLPARVLQSALGQLRSGHGRRGRGTGRQAPGRAGRGGTVPLAGGLGRPALGAAIGRARGARGAGGRRGRRGGADRRERPGRDAAGLGGYGTVTGVAPPLDALVLGVGGNVSQSILKALALAPTPTRVVAACISPSSVGLYSADRAYLSPLARDSEFIPWMIGICQSEAIDIVMSGSEIVLEVLSGQ